MMKSTFHSVRIGATVFSGFIDGAGPAMRCETGSLPLSEGLYLQRHDSGIWEVRRPKEGFSMVLPVLTDDQVATLSQEFGLGCDQVPGALPRCKADVWSCRAFDGLAAWVHEHPRLAQKLAGFDTHLSAWKDRARERGIALGLAG